MTGLATSGDRRAPHLPVGSELLEMPVTCALFGREVRAPADTFFHHEVIGEGVVGPDPEDQAGARRKRLARLGDRQRLGRGEGFLPGGAPIIGRVQNILVEVLRKRGSVGLSVGCRSEQRDQGKAGGDDRNVAHGWHEAAPRVAGFGGRQFWPVGWPPRCRSSPAARRVTSGDHSSRKACSLESMYRSRWSEPKRP
jgi:hypothetical protein